MTAAHDLTPHFDPESICDPDAELVRRCQAREDDAARSFEALMDRHAIRIHRRAARILGSECDADDIVQEVFVSVHRFIDRYRPERPFSHWLSVVTLNACRIELRRRSSRDRRHDANRRDPLRATDGILEVDPILRDWLVEKLEDLQEATRRSILLRVVEGLSYPEIAKHEGASIPAVKMRVARGLRDLRKCYEIEMKRIETSRKHRQPKIELRSGGAISMQVS